MYFLLHCRPVLIQIQFINYPNIPNTKGGLVTQPAFFYAHISGPESVPGIYQIYIFRIFGA